MEKFLVRDFDSPFGYKEIDGPLERTRYAYYVPWAVSISDERVVYARMEEARGTPTRNGLLQPYNTEVSKTRRSYCHTELGLYALDENFSKNALKTVSDQVLQFLNKKHQNDPNATKDNFSKKVGKYLYGIKAYGSFGRISDTEPSQVTVDKMWNDSVSVLNANTPLATVLSIHDAVGRALIDQVQDKDIYRTYVYWVGKMRADSDGEIINKDSRGRENRKKDEYSLTELPGNILIPKSGFKSLQIRNRGTDMFKRILPKMPPAGISIPPEKSGHIYYQQLDLRNELFGAGPSGTTGTALSAALTFGIHDVKHELFKQYLFALIGYLVGGGMHSLHESLSILRLIGLEYNTGTLLGYDYNQSPAPADSKGLVIGKVSDNFPLLPITFLGSKEFQEWQNKYYDIVVLGGIHWKFNNR